MNKEPYILLYIKRDDIYYIYISGHYTDTTASTLTRLSSETVKDIQLKFFIGSNALMAFRSAWKMKKLAKE